MKDRRIIDGVAENPDDMTADDFEKMTYEAEKRHNTRKPRGWFDDMEEDNTPANDKYDYSQDL